MTEATRIGVDVGGTFTDVVLMVEGDLHTLKVPTTANQSDGVMAGINAACKAGGIDPSAIDSFTHAMTVTTNALLEGEWARTALVTTAGFRDVLEIRRQNRPSLYDLEAEIATPLASRNLRFELEERATPEGIEAPVDAAEVRAVAERIKEQDVESVAVCLLHAYAHPENEQRAGEILREELSVPVSLSHEVLPAFREYERTATTVVNAAIRPTIEGYLGDLDARTDDLSLPSPGIMQSNGGIAGIPSVQTNAVATVLSGPAAGVVGGASANTSIPETDGCITFDMGGTSSDVGLVRDSEIKRSTETEINGRPIALPMVDVNTVGSGGGSIAWVDDGGALRVGPRSAGADPGPACYGQGGTEPTVTDANVVCGYIGESTALGGELILDTEAARTAISEIAREIDLDPIEAASGIHRVVNARMTRAIRSVTVEKGHDPRQFALVAFGGAGPTCACALADRLDIETVVVPLPAGVLSAYGLLDADEKYDAMGTHKRRLDEITGNVIEAAFRDLIVEGDLATTESVGNAETATIERFADLRYVGQSFELTVPVAESIGISALRERFHAAHETTNGYRMDEAVELVNIRATATIERDPVVVEYNGRGDALKGTREAYFHDTFHETPVYARERLPTEETVSGPAVLEQNESTTVIPPAWSGTVQENGTIVLRSE